MFTTNLCAFVLFLCASCQVTAGEPAPVPLPEPRGRYNSKDYDKDMLESVLKEVLNDEITKIGKPGGGRGVGSRSLNQDDDQDDRSESHRKPSNQVIGMDDYLDRLTGSSDSRPSSDDFVEKVRSGARDKLSDSQSDQQQQYGSSGNNGNNGNYRDLEQEVAMLEEKLRNEKSMRHKLEQQEARLREQRLQLQLQQQQQQHQQQQEKVREERRRLEQLLAEEKAAAAKARQHHSPLSPGRHRHKITSNKILESEDLAFADAATAAAAGISDASSIESSDLDRLNLKSYSSALAAAAGVSDPDLKSLETDDISLKSKFFNSHADLLDTDALTASSLSLRSPSSALESAIRNSPSFASSLSSHSSLMSPKPHSLHHHSHHGRPAHHPHHHHHGPSLPPPPHHPFGYNPHPGSSFSSPSHAASSYSPAFAPKYPPLHGPPHYMPGMMRGPPHRPLSVGPPPHGPGYGSRAFGPGISPYHSPGPYGAASSLSTARFPPHGPLPPPPLPPASPLTPTSLHSLAASMYPSLYAGLNQRSSSPSPNAAIQIGSTPGQTGVANASEAEKKDPKGKKIKSMLMDFAVSSILDVGMMNLMGNILGKINPETGSSTRTH